MTNQICSGCGGLTTEVHASLLIPTGTSGVYYCKHLICEKCHNEEFHPRKFTIMFSGCKVPYAIYEYPPDSEGVTEIWEMDTSTAKALLQVRQSDIHHQEAANDENPPQQCPEPVS